MEVQYKGDRGMRVFFLEKWGKLPEDGGCYQKAWWPCNLMESKGGKGNNDVKTRKRMRDDDKNLFISLLLIFTCFSSSICRRRSIKRYVKPTRISRVMQEQSTFCGLNARILCFCMLLPS